MGRMHRISNNLGTERVPPIELADYRVFRRLGVAKYLPALKWPLRGLPHLMGIGT